MKHPLSITLTEDQYTSRVDELVDFCQSVYGLDRATVELICIALLPTDAIPVWPCFEVAFTAFWSDLACVLRTGIITPDCIEVTDMCQLNLRPRQQVPIVLNWLHSRDKPRIFIDTEFSTPRVYPGVHNRAKSALEQVVRYRTPNGLIRIPPPTARQELSRLLVNAVHWQYRAYMPVPVQANDQMGECTRIVSRLNTDYTRDYYPLMRNLCLIPSARASLLGRTRVEPTDWLLCLQVMQGSVREWTWRILGEFTAGKGSVCVAALSQQVGVSEELVRRECGRLYMERILTIQRGAGSAVDGRKVWIGPNKESGVWMDIEAFVSGDVRWW